MPDGPQPRPDDGPRPGWVGVRAEAAGLAVICAAILGGVLAGCGGGGGGSGAEASSTTASSAALPTTATTSADAAEEPPKQLGSPAAVRSVVETVLTSSDPADACGKYVTQHYLRVAYGGKQACVQAQRPGVAATSLSSFRIDSQAGKGKAVNASVVLHGGPYDGSIAKVGLLFQARLYRINALGANVPVGP